MQAVRSRWKIPHTAIARLRPERTMPETEIRTSISHHEAGTVAWLSVDNRSKLNVVGRELICTLREVLERLADDQALRALVLRGAGSRAFIGGADIREMVQLDERSAREFITSLHGLCHRLRDFPVPTLARIEGFCLGAGMEIAASCDLRAASNESKFGMPEVRVGIPSVIEAALLPRLVGWGRACELVLTGNIFDAAEAYEMGFVQRLVPAAELDDAVNRWIDSILAAGPEAIRSQKELLKQWARLDLDAAIDAGVDFFSAAYRTEEPRQMMRSFLDARP